MTDWIFLSVYPQLFCYVSRVGIAQTRVVVQWHSISTEIYRNFPDHKVLVSWLFFDSLEI